MPVCEFAASLLLSLFEYKDILKNEVMDIDLQGKTALCMSQYKTLLGTSRIPGMGRDTLKTDESSSHAVVIAGGRYYSIYAQDKKDRAKNYHGFCKAMKAILESSYSAQKFSIGNLTSQNRDTWARLRNHLIEIDPTNKTSLDKIEGALAIICLDQNEVGSGSAMFKSMLAGNPENRWFDKSIQLILSKDGQFAVNYEHSGVDGTTIGNLVRYLYKNMHAYRMPLPQAPTIRIEEISFKMDSLIENEIKSAIIQSKKAYDNLSIDVLFFREFGKDKIKALQISPDSFIQLAFQRAQKKTFGRVENTYEAVMTKQFLHGRTEAMRPVTAESLNYVNNPSRSNLDKAGQSHIERIRECKKGHGIERHLFGLKKMHQHFLPGKNLDQVFHSPAYKSITRNFLSTSTSNSEGLLLAGYGPSIKEGYGLRYLIYNDQVHFVLSSMADNKAFLLKLKENLKESLMEMASIDESE